MRTKRLGQPGPLPLLNVLLDTEDRTRAEDAGTGLGLDDVLVARHIV